MKKRKSWYTICLFSTMFSTNSKASLTIKAKLNFSFTKCFKMNLPQIWTSHEDEKFILKLSAFFHYYRLKLKYGDYYDFKRILKIK